MPVSINIPGNNREVESKTKSLQKLADNLDSEALSTIAGLSKNEKAIKYLKNLPTIVKAALGIK